MDANSKVVSIFLITSIIVGVISNFIFTYALSNFYASTIGQTEAIYESPILAAAVASGMFTILLLYYPVVKKGERDYTGEDFR
ncbi:MAG: hypothetical protein M1414_04725 [Candidatus Thermoplasmatota archaeon]|nr:hypothetical protein [Candidatus Thermoplasmatota archaeon]MCL5988191.1 hypothetical protein [Candidatus Thermoplasmatota archaeon]